MEDSCCKRCTVYKELFPVLLSVDKYCCNNKSVGPNHIFAQTGNLVFLFAKIIGYSWLILLQPPQYERLDWSFITLIITDQNQHQNLPQQGLSEWKSV